MSFFGLPEARVAPLVRAVSRPDLARDELLDRFARAAFSGIAEPGDGAAGALLQTMGAPAALGALVEQWPLERLAAAARERGAELDGEQLGEALERWRPRLRSAIALIALQQSARFAIRLLVPGDPAWPSGLAGLGPHAPGALWVRGSDLALRALGCSFALVGARAATPYGEAVTGEASAGLVDRGFAIVSGAAYGIDGMAHRAALASGGTTVAVLAGGLDRFYPAGHESLIGRIAEQGAVVAEVPCGTPPTKWRFLQRNRLIAAVSQVTVVLEAGRRSGSLNTAGHAAALGRPLGAVPGPVTSPASAGCHRLIREYDAVCVTGPDEMAQLHPAVDLVESAFAAAPADSDQVRVLDALSARAPRTADDVAARAGMAVVRVLAVLGTLELDGRAEQRPGGWVRSAATR